MSYLEVGQLNKSFVDSKGGHRHVVHAVDNLSVEVEEGQILALLGASGSGKTTLLRCVAGLEQPDSGLIRVAGKAIYDSESGVDVPAHKRNMGMVFQSYALWPHLTVEQNVAYPLIRRRIANTERSERVSRYLALVDCAALGRRFPHELSGGQQQRIALARALVAHPSIVLFDEPLSNLDANLREQLRYQIREVQRREGFTGLYVTHDHAEALFIADRIAIISNGRLLQVGSPDDLYGMPASAEVAEFLGATNSLVGQVESDDHGLGFKSTSGRISLTSLRSVSTLTTGAAVLKCHPSWSQVAGKSDGDGLVGTVVDTVRAAPDTVEYLVALADDNVWRCRMPMDANTFAIGEVVTVHPSVRHAYIFEVA